MRDVLLEMCVGLESVALCLPCVSLFILSFLSLTCFGRITAIVSPYPSM